MADKSAPLLKEVLLLDKKIKTAEMPIDLQERALLMTQRLERLARFGEYLNEYERIAYYIDWLVNLPWHKRSQDVLDLEHAKKILDQNHCGLEKIKERILEYMAVLKLQKNQPVGPGDQIQRHRAPILCFVGLVGTGKTTIAASIAQAMGRKFARIPFGGLADASDLRGQSKFKPDAEPGLIIKALRKGGTKNPVILLDEIDRVAGGARGSIMGVLIELLDPEQNMAFRDHFIDYPFDLSEVLFIATANNTTNISVAVMDRLEPIQMPSYSDKEKIEIGRDYLFPKILRQIGLNKETVEIDNDVWPKIVRPLGYDAGVRTLERTIDGIGRKIAKMIVESGEKGKRVEKFHLTLGNIKKFLPAW